MSVIQDESVWLEEVDAGLVEHLSKILTLPIRTSEVVDNKVVSLVKNVPIPVRPRKPDTDFMKEEYPMVTFFCMQILDGWERQDIGTRIIEEDREKHTGIAETVAKSFDLHYQFDFWADKVSDMNTLLRKFMYKCHKDFVLPVKDVSGNARDCLCVATGGIRTLDYVNSEQDEIRKLLHRTVTYRIYVELDQREREVVNIISQITPSVNKEG